LKRAVGLCKLAALFSKIKKPLQRGSFILIIFTFCQRNLKNIQTTEVYNLKTYSISLTMGKVQYRLRTLLRKYEGFKRNIS
jgi:hypothetical protein